jgi:hypothetical protein
MERTTVPFRVGTSDMTTQTSTRGVVRIEGGQLVIEFRETTTDMMSLKTLDGPVREVRIPLQDVESVEIGRRWLWGGTLCIRVRKLGPVAGAPGVTGNELRLRIRRRDHDRSRAVRRDLAHAGRRGHPPARGKRGRKLSGSEAAVRH